MNTHMLIIDPQNDFCNPQGSLFVKGADSDMARLSVFIDENGKNINQIHVTLDSHRTVDIAHPIFWVDKDGKHPQPFTMISAKDVENGVWKATKEKLADASLAYVQKLAQNGKYPLVIWPPHCIIGSWGHSIAPVVSNSLIKWENENFGIVNYIPKGSNVMTEHYSAIKADVPDPKDPSTTLNVSLLSSLSRADAIYVAGEALSHCVANTVRDMVDNGINPQRIILLDNTCSSVTGFEALGEKFIDDMINKGMQLHSHNKN